MSDDHEHHWVLVEVALTSTTADNVYECTGCTAASVGRAPDTDVVPLQAAQPVTVIHRAEGGPPL